jgi:hypothetical protein
VDQPVAQPEDSKTDASMCWRTRKRATQARDAQDWDGVLRHTRDAGCWTTEREQRKRLRAMAYKELKNWSACVEASRGLTDSEGRKWLDLCQRRKEQG